MELIIKILLLIVCFSVGIMAEENTIYIIVNKNNPINELSQKEVHDYFLKKRKLWSNGNKVIPIDHYSQSQSRKIFSEVFLGKSVNQVKAYWQNSVFSGKDTPPLEKVEEMEVIRFVENNINAIAYISSKTKHDNVKVIKIIID